jgi:hypothetical protein
MGMARRWEMAGIRHQAGQAAQAAQAAVV